MMFDRVLYISFNRPKSSTISLPWSNVIVSRTRDHNRDKDIQGFDKDVSLSNAVPTPSSSRNKAVHNLPNGIDRVSSPRRSDCQLRPSQLQREHTPALKIPWAA